MRAIKTPIYQTPQIREFERLAQTRFDIAPSVLMQRAGHAAFDFFMRRGPQAKSIAVFCGSGNNGGDGYVFAQLAQERGLTVKVWQLGQHDKMKDEAKQAQQKCLKANVSMSPFTEKLDLQQTDVVVDAMCGIGLSTDLREETRQVIEKIQRSQLPVLAMDIPTGIEADTGRVLGGALHATATMTFIGFKLGLMTGNGMAYAGELVLNDLQLPVDVFAGAEPVAEKIHLNAYAPYLKPRLRDWHKGLSGHVLVVGGHVGFSGAVNMAAQAAFRVGAGRVSVATRPEHAAVLTAACPEIMCHGVESARALQPLIEKADVIVVGPGMGLTAWSRALWQAVMAVDKPLVVDADGLNMLAKTKLAKENWVLTPHPGEAARLLKKTTTEVQADRLAAGQALQKHYGGGWVLKGAGRLVA